MAAPPAARLVLLAKRLVAGGLYYSGILTLWSRVTLRQRAVVLTYHRVLSCEDAARTWSHPGIVVTRETFDRHVRLLARHFRILSIGEFVDVLESGAGFDRPSCLITFDDGWKDTCTEAGPILARHGAPAVVFLPVDFIGTSRMFWQEELGALLAEAWQRSRADTRFRAAAAASLARHGADTVLGASPDAMRLTIQTWVNRRKNETLERPSALITDLEALLGGRPPAAAVDGFMTWDEVRRMTASGTAFGGHGASHRILTTIPPEEAGAEAADSMRVLTRELGAAPVSFAYPNGNADAAVADGVRRAGFRVAFTTERGCVAPGDDRLRLRRVNMHEDVTRSGPQFLARVTGVFG